MHQEEATTQVAKIIDLLLGQYTTSILVRRSNRTLRQYSFLENSVDIGKIHWSQYQVVIVFILIYNELFSEILLTQYSISDIQMSIMTRYLKYHCPTTHFWKIRLILEKYINPIIILYHWPNQDFKKLVFSYVTLFWLRFQIWISVYDGLT